MAYDAAIIGGGIIGAAAAAMLAEDGASVVLVEREDIAAGASGRNSGALQQPFDVLRVCTRPMSFDGRPLIGPVAGVSGLFACTGHGPWGLSTGPSSARLVVEQMLARAPDATLAGPLSPDRWPVAPADSPADPG